jgi:hypothetical protein
MTGYTELIAGLIPVSGLPTILVPRRFVDTCAFLGTDSYNLLN